MTAVLLRYSIILANAAEFSSAESENKSQIGPPLLVLAGFSRRSPELHHLVNFRRERAPATTEPATSATDPERADDSPNTCCSRIVERTMTAPPVDPD
jgi:hypothetical protein